MCFDVITKMGTGSDATICRINENEIVVDGDLVVNGVSIEDMQKRLISTEALIEDMQKRLRELEKTHK